MKKEKILHRSKELRELMLRKQALEAYFVEFTKNGEKQTYEMLDEYARICLMLREEV